MFNQTLKYLLLTAIFNFIGYSQIENQIVCETEATIDPGSTTWGLYKPAQTNNNEYFRVLFAFAQFASDNVANSEWPVNQLPNWKNDLIDSTLSTVYRDETLSDFFDKASLGKYDFIGDIYEDTIIIPSNMVYQDANKYVITELNNNILDFSRYDKWKAQNGNFIFSENGPNDGFIDMLIIIYRNAHSTF